MKCNSRDGDARLIFVTVRIGWSLESNSRSAARRFDDDMTTKKKLRLGARKRG